MLLFNFHESKDHVHLLEVKLNKLFYSLSMIDY